VRVEKAISVPKHYISERLTGYMRLMVSSHFWTIFRLRLGEALGREKFELGWKIMVTSFRVYIGKTFCAGFKQHISQMIQEINPVGVILKYFSSLDASYSDVMKGARSINTGLAWHTRSTHHISDKIETHNLRGVPEVPR